MTTQKNVIQGEHLRKYSLIVSAKIGFSITLTNMWLGLSPSPIFSRNSLR